MNALGAYPDDHDLVRLVLRSALEVRGYSVTEAANGTQLLALMSADVDLLLMPGCQARHSALDRPWLRRAEASVGLTT